MRTRQCQASVRRAYGRHLLAMRDAKILIISLILALTVAACGGASSEPDTSSDPDSAGASDEPEAETTDSGDSIDEDLPELKIAMLATQLVTAGDWDPAGAAGARGMADVFSASYDVTLSFAENAGYDEASSIMRDFADQGYDIIIAHSSAYEPSILEVAPEYPDTWFIVFSGLSSTQDLPNVAGWQINWVELGYMQGAIACLASESGQIGHINSVPIPAFTQSAGGAELAAERYCDGTPAYSITWIDSFTDVALAYDATLALKEQGADVFFDSADTAGEGVFQAAIDEDLLMVGKYFDQSSAIPTMITSVTIDFDGSFRKMAELHLSGDLEPKIYNVSFETDGLAVVTPFDNSSPEVESEALVIIERLISGEEDVPDDRRVEP